MRPRDEYDRVAGIMDRHDPIEVEEKDVARRPPTEARPLANKAAAARQRQAELRRRLRMYEIGGPIEPRSRG